MAIETIELTIEGLSPLLMHAFPLAQIEAIEKKSPQEQAEISAYRDAEGMLFIPAVALQRALVKGAAYSKGKGRASLQKVVAACVLITPEHLLLGQRDFVVDSRAVVVPATKGRVVRHRPKLEKWKVTAAAEFDPNLLTAAQLRRVVDDTGTRVGLLDYRPERTGPFGRFMVVAWN